MKKVIIFTDGSCLGNPGPGGWGAILKYNDSEKKLYGGEDNTTNNRMELTAAIKALQALKESCYVTITTDSQYVKKGITEWIKRWQQNGWKTAAKKPVKNKDLWQELASELERHKVSWHWVKGHAGHEENEMVDELAKRGAEELCDK